MTSQPANSTAISTASLPPRILEVRQGLLKANDQLARDLRAEFSRAGVFVVNVVSGPGAGKTELLARTLKILKERGRRVAAIVGDLATDNDARRLSASGAEARQIITGDGLPPRGRRWFAPPSRDGPGRPRLPVHRERRQPGLPGLVRPGRASSRACSSPVTEGEDKPLKYPTLINTADVTVISKVDLADAVGFDRATARRNLDDARPGAVVLELSARAKTWDSMRGSTCWKREEGCK